MSIGWNETGGSLPFGPKPTAPVINWQDPLTNGLVFCTDYAAPSVQRGKDLVAGTTGVYTGTAPNCGPFGFHRTFQAATDKDAYTFATGSAAAAIAGGALSIEFIFKGNVDAFGVIFTVGDLSAGDGDAFINILWDDTSHAISTEFGRSTTSGAWHDTNAVFSANQFHHCIITYDGSSTSNNPIIYKNGAQQPVTNSTAPVGTRVTNNSSVLVGNFPGQNFGIQADIEYVRLWNRILTSVEARALAGNPWKVYRQPFGPVATNLPSTAVSGSAAWTEAQDTLAATGSVIVSGSGALLEIQDALAASGSVIVSGAAALLEIQDSLAATGTVSLSPISGSAAWTEVQDRFSAIGNNGLLDAHDPGIRKRRSKLEGERFEDERAKRARRRAQVIDAFERVIEGKPEISDAVADEIMSDAFGRFAEHEQGGAPHFDLEGVLASTERVQALWNKLLDRDDEEVLVLL